MVDVRVRERIAVSGGCNGCSSRGSGSMRGGSRCCRGGGALQAASSLRLLLTLRFSRVYACAFGFSLARVTLLLGAPRRGATFRAGFNLCANTIPQRCRILYVVITAIFIGVWGFFRGRRCKDYRYRRLAVRQGVGEKGQFYFLALEIRLCSFDASCKVKLARHCSRDRDRARSR